MIRFFIAVGVACFVVSCSNDVEQKVVKQNEVVSVQRLPTPIVPVVPKSNIEYYPNDSISRIILDSALECLKLTCIHIKNYTKNAEKISLHYNAVNIDYRAKKYGWKKIVEIDIAIPRDYDRFPVDMAGVTLYYYMGNGKTPGVLTAKTQAKLLCGIHTESSDDVFIPVEKEYLWLR